jgi:hypothetical protein
MQLSLLPSEMLNMCKDGGTEARRADALSGHVRPIRAASTTTQSDANRGFPVSDE